MAIPEIETTKKRKKTFVDFDDDDDPLSKKLCSSDTERTGLRMMVGDFYLPKENRDRPLGEDAHFISFDEQTIGVADGVGGWARKGIDSGVYARELMGNARSSIEDHPSGKVDPMRALEEAFFSTEAKGSSTACIITLKDDFLHAASLGDSGFVVIRDGRIVYKSPIQQSSFNCPYQLGISTGYDPESAMEILFPVEPGDVVVAATDGLFDNVFPEEIEDIVNFCQDQGCSPDLMAWNLGEKARKLSIRDDFVSPFTQAAMEIGRDFEDYKGGKYDDVTVVVGYIY